MNQATTFLNLRLRSFSWAYTRKLLFEPNLPHFLHVIVKKRLKIYSYSAIGAPEAFIVHARMDGIAVYIAYNTKENRPNGARKRAKGI